MTTNEILSAIKKTLGKTYWNHATRNNDEILMVWFVPTDAIKEHVPGGEIVFNTKMDTWEADRFAGDKKRKGKGIDSLIEFLEGVVRKKR